MQKHSTFVLSTGGDMALDKCRFYFIKYAFDCNHDPYILSKEQNPGELIITNILTNELTTIKRVEATEARKTLVCLVTPTNEQSHQFQAVREKIIIWKQYVTFSSLSGPLILHAYETILKPQLTYRFATTSFSFQQCEDLVKLIRPIILHSHRTHKNFPKCILESSSLCAGYNFNHFYDLQGFEKLKFFTHHLRRLDATGETLIISLQYTQLSIGIGSFFMNLPYEEYSFLTDSTWSTHLWEYLSDKDLCVDIAHQILIPHQRKNDAYIMDILLPHFSVQELQRINKIRVSLQLLFLSDVTDSRGRHILPDIKLGISYRTSNIQFPPQTFSPSWISLWKKACIKLSKYLSNNPLGTWKHMNHQWKSHLSSCQKYISYNRRYFHRNNSTNLFLPCPQPSTEISFPTPVDICSTKQGIKLITTHSSLDTTSVIPSPITDSFQLCGAFESDDELNIVEAIKTNKAKMCCDGSVKNQFGSFAYGIAPPGSDTPLFAQHAPVHGDLEQITSTHCELMGILVSIEYLRYLSSKYNFEQRHFILMTADNENAIKSPKKSFLSSKHVFSADMDIILHIQFLLKSTPFNIRFHHVCGHQDKHKAYSSLSTLAKLNVKMDELAKQYFSNPSNNSPTYSLHENVGKNKLQDSLSRSCSFYHFYFVYQVRSFIPTIAVEIFII